MIGIDPGTAITGWGVLEFRAGSGTSSDGGGEGLKLEVIDFGCIKTSPNQSPEERLKKIYTDLLAVIERTKPDDMAIEKIFFNINVKTALSVGQARGVCMLAAAITSLSAYEYNTSEVKSMIAGHGRASKQEVASEVTNLLGLEKTPKPDDVTDALAIAAAHIFTTCKNCEV